MILKFFRTNYLVIAFIAGFVFKNILILLDLVGIRIHPFYYPVALAFGTLFFLPAFFLTGKKRTIYCYTVALVTSIILLGDLVYFRYYTAVPSFSSLVTAPQLLTVTDSIFSLIYPRDILLFLDALAIFVVSRRLLNWGKEKYSPIWNLLPIAGILLVFTAIFFNDRVWPIKLFVFNNYESKMIVQRYGFFGSHIFDGVRTVVRRQVPLTESEEAALFSFLKKDTDEKNVPNELTGKYKDKNIILIQWESLQSFVVGKKIEGKEVAPNLNKLVKQSHYFKNNQFLVGLGNTSDADMAVNTSLYPLSDAATGVRYADDNFNALPKSLAEQGYSTTAYHANNRDFWNRNKSYKSLGYQEFVARENYKPGKKIGMGLSDEEFFLQTAEKISKKEGPSFNYLITLSSHHPYFLDGIEGGLDISDNELPPEVNRYYKLISYSDMALGKFITSLKEKGLYDDSIFVIVGDHSANLGEISNEKFKVENVETEKGYLDSIKVPLIIKLPNQNKGIERNILTSNLDVMPTILNLVGANKNIPMLGRDVFSNVKPFFATMLVQTRAFATDGNSYFWTDGYKGYCTNGDSGKLNSSQCDSLARKKTNYISASEKLIKNNLFEKANVYLSARKLINSKVK